MPYCSACNREVSEITELDLASGLCGECGESEFSDHSNPEVRSRLNSIQLTTTPSLPGHRVVETMEIVTAECAFGMNIFRDFFASLTDVFGGRSEASQKVLRDARRVCLRELQKEALAVGANAVIGTRLDYTELSGKGKSMLLLVASGTAVRTELHHGQGA